MRETLLRLNELVGAVSKPSVFSTGGAAMRAVNLFELNQDDEILIRTRSSEYSFHLTNPETGTGTLSGGVLGSKSILVCFMGSRSGAGLPFESNMIRIGSSAAFLVGRPRSMKTLITSLIVELITYPATLRFTSAQL